jgi:hypothetical protein
MSHRKHKPHGVIEIHIKPDEAIVSMLAPGLPGVIVGRASLSEALHALAEHVARREASVLDAVGDA